MVWAGAAAWGMSGTAAQRLFASHAVSPDWLVTVRMLSAGAVLLVWAIAAHEDVTAVFRSRRSLLELLVFSVFGLFAVQVTYLRAIAAADAPVATILQSLGVVYLAAYVALARRRRPAGVRLAAMLLALAGTVLMVTGGHRRSLAVTTPGLVWGMLSGLALAFYTAYPRPLMARAGATSVVGWAMLFGGVVAAAVQPPWAVRGTGLDLENLLLVAFVSLVGTALAFRLYLGSLSQLAPQDTALLSTAEPLSSAVTAWLWLGTPLPPATILGGCCIVCGVVLVGRAPPPDMEEGERLGREIAAP